MKNRWMDVVKRGSISLSPTSEKVPALQLSQQVLQQSRSMSTLSNASEVENPAFLHHIDKCQSIGTCSVAHVLENCVLQGGVHHTHMNVLTYLGNPLRSDCCCYPRSVQWFRAFGDRDDFQAIPGACNEWFTATADDIGARILAKVMIEDEDVVKTKMLEYGPIKEDPEVRSKVEMYLERKSVLFMGLQSITVQDGVEYMNEELRESWTLLIDDRRVRLTCESSLIPPFEGFYTSDIKVEIVRSTANEFCLFLAENCFVRLRAESNTVRDIIVLTLRAFCKNAIQNDAIQGAVPSGSSPMLTIRKLADAEKPAPVEPIAPPPVPTYDLPWNRPHNLSGADLSEISEIDEEEVQEFGDNRPSLTNSAVGFVEDVDDSLLLEAEALIGNAMKMGIKNQILPRAPKRISMADIPDLQIIEAIESGSGRRRKTKRSMSVTGSTGSTTRDSFDESSSDESGLEGSVVDGSDQPCYPPPLESESIDEAIQAFSNNDQYNSSADDLSSVRKQYVTIFCALQNELRNYKQRVKKLTQQVDEQSEANTSFRKDIENLQSALTAIQIADKVHDKVTDDLQLFLQQKSMKFTMKSLPENYY